VTPQHHVRSRVKYVGDAYYDDRSGTPVLVQEFAVPSPGPQCVHAELTVVISGSTGVEKDPPAGAPQPTLIGWEDDRGEVHDSEQVRLDGGDRLWRVLVRPAPDTVTEIVLKAEGAEA
jgi:hypothetical protein